MVPLPHRTALVVPLAVLVLATAGVGQQANAQPGAFPNAFPSPPSKYPVLDYQLRLAFDHMDQNQDGFLDKNELAKAFRGPKAKEAPPVYDDQGRVNPDARQASTKYPDLICLMTLDKDGDEQISWNEYRTYYENVYANSVAASRGPLQAVNYAPRQQSGYNRGLGNSSSQNYRNANRNANAQARSYAQNAQAVLRQQKQYAQQAINYQQNLARIYAQNLVLLQRQRQQYVQRIQTQRQQAYRQAINNIHHVQQQRARTTHHARRR